MKVAVLSESPADEAAIRSACEGASRLVEAAPWGSLETRVMLARSSGRESQAAVSP
jgi:hypothetical protein